MSGPLDWNSFAHRALVTASLYGLGPRSGPPKVACARDLEGVRDAHVVVTADAAALDVSSLSAARDATSPEGVVAVVVASTSAAGLIASAPVHEPGRTDAFARAAAWAALAARRPQAPAVSAARLREIAAAASSAGLVLVEPDVPYARTQPRHPVDRAVLATISLGATARPLLFLREGRAPRAGLARIRDERLLDGWVEGRGSRPTGASPSLRDAALEMLADVAAPMRGSDLLREARARWTDAARAAGTRATTSSADALSLARDLRVLWLDGAIEVYASDPAVPLVTA